jgi:hypothetical protein
MRYAVIAGAMVMLVACSSRAPGSATLVLNDPYWERVNVQVVITKNGDCDTRGPDLISSRELVMAKNKLETFEVPEGAIICWRHDRDPNNPAQGDWSGWTKATLFPGQETKTEL